MYSTILTISICMAHIIVVILSLSLNKAVSATATEMKHRIIIIVGALKWNYMYILIWNLKML